MQPWGNDPARRRSTPDHVNAKKKEGQKAKTSHMGWINAQHHSTPREREIDQIPDVLVVAGFES